MPKLYKVEVQYAERFTGYNGQVKEIYTVSGGTAEAQRLALRHFERWVTARNFPRNYFQYRIVGLQLMADEVVERKR